MLRKPGLGLTAGRNLLQGRWCPASASARSARARRTYDRIMTGT